MSNSVSATLQFSMTGVDVSASNVIPTDTGTSTTVGAAVAARLPNNGGTLTGPLTLAADPTTSLQAATKHYVDTSAASGMPVTGATMTGPLLLSANPTTALQAAPKQYVDSQVATALPTSGGTLTGPLYTMSTGNSAATGNNIGTFDGFGSEFSFRRQVTSGAPGQPTVYVGLTNFSNAYTSYYSTGEYADVPAMIIQAQNVPGSTGQLNGLKILLNSGGNNPFDAEDQGLNVQVVKAGQNSTWAINTQSLDTTGLPPQSFSTVGAEIDLGGSGYDAAASAYDPFQSNRATMWFNGRPYPWPNWAASTTYGAGSVVVATPSGGVPSTYIAQNSGTSASSAPSWPASGAVTDNGITWQYGTTAAFSIGRGIWFDSNLGPNQFQWGTCISGDAIVQNAFLDTQRVSFASSGGAAIRLSTNQVIDFSGNLTAAGQNQHTLKYSSSSGGLTYNIGTTGTVTSICLKDNFQVSIAGPTSIANSAKGVLTGITTGYNPAGLTIGWSYANLGETDLMVGANGLNVYPVSASGMTPASPIFTIGGAGNLAASGSLTVGASLTVAGIASFANSGAGNLLGVTSGYSPQGLTVGWSYANNGETDFMVDGNGLNIYPVSATGTVPASPIFALGGTGNLKAFGSLTAGTSLSVAGVSSFANALAGNLLGITAGYNPQGLTVGWSYANNGETDFMVDSNGLNVYPVSATGTTPALPILALNGSGNLKAFGSLSAGTTLSVSGTASLANTISGSLHGITTGYVPQGLTVGWSYANTGETDLMVGANGLNVYPVSSTGTTPASPIFAVGSSGNLTAYGVLTASSSLSVAGSITAPGLKVSASYASDQAAAAGGVVVGQFYRNGSAIQMRMS